jgi:hypothetical protein
MNTVKSQVATNPGAHTQLVRARIAFSNSGLCADHAYLAKPDSVKPASPGRLMRLAGENVDALHARDVAACLLSEMEDRMTTLAKEMDKLDAEYVALDRALYAEQ